MLIKKLIKWSVKLHCTVLHCSTYNSGIIRTATVEDQVLVVQQQWSMDPPLFLRGEMGQWPSRDDLEDAIHKKNPSMSTGREILGRTWQQPFQYTHNLSGKRERAKTNFLEGKNTFFHCVLRLLLCPSNFFFFFEMSLRLFFPFLASPFNNEQKCPSKSLITRFRFSLHSLFLYPFFGVERGGLG